MDESELDDELGELERELKAEKQIKKKQEVPGQQMAIWLIDQLITV